MVWEKENNRLLFWKDNQTPIALNYDFDDSVPSGAKTRGFFAAAFPDNCDGASSSAAISATLDDVLVNQSGI